MIATLVAVFILSGAAGLIYESIWSRYLGLFVGHSAYAQIIVLVIFLGGMSLGAHLVGQRSSRLRTPLLWYAGVEFVVGVLAFTFHEVFLASTAWAYDSVFPSLGGTSLMVVKWTIAGVLILPQSVLLGATFPLMSAGVIRMARAEEAPGRLLGLLYFANSIGAAAGVLVAGFVLIEKMGLPGTLVVAAIINVFAACIVGLIARAHDRQLSADQAAEIPIESREPSAESRVPPEWRALLIVSFGTAVASFVYEIAWIRMLSLVLGSATHSFELMLSAFILGLALGALWIRTRADRLADPVRFLGYVQWAMGLLAVATLPLYVASFDWMATILDVVKQTESGYRVFAFLRYIVALVIMLPATFCAGMTLPLITRVLMRGGAGERAIGTVYAVNTLGSIVGVILAGLVLMPWLGLKRLLIVGALLDIGLGAWLVARTQRPPPKRSWWDDRLSLTIPVIATLVLITLLAAASKFSLLRLTSGVYRHGVVERSDKYTYPFYKDGRTATVSVQRGPTGFITLATNGKPDASMDQEWLDTTGASQEERHLSRDIGTQLLLPIITLAHGPLSEYAAVIGQGSGMSSHVLLGSPLVRQVVTIEIESEILKASRAFSPANRRVFEDPRSTFVVDDAKSYFASSGRKFDLILSEPSNPWVSGVSNLFTEEFYSRVKNHLSDRGVFGQWLHLYELNDGLVNSVLAAIDTVFPAYEVFYTSEADILIVAAKRRLPEPQWTVSAYAGIAEDLKHVIPFRPESFEALRLAGRSTLHPMLLVYGTPNSDFFPTLDLNAEKMRFLHEGASGYTNMTLGRFDIVAALTGRRVGFGTMVQSPTPEIARSVALALSTRLHAIRTDPNGLLAKLPPLPELKDALYRAEELDRGMAVSRPPADWNAWMHSVVDVDADLHSGTAGVVDTVFYQRVRRYAAQNGAPSQARAAINFLHGIGAWDWPEAAAAADTLMRSGDAALWLPPVRFRNGAAVAFIMLRDYASAKKVLQQFTEPAGDDQFRERIIGSILLTRDPELRKKMGWK